MIQDGKYKDAFAQECICCRLRCKMCFFLYTKFKMFESLFYIDLIHSLDKLFHNVDMLCSTYLLSQLTDISFLIYRQYRNKHVSFYACPKNFGGQIPKSIIAILNIEQVCFQFCFSITKMLSNVSVFIPLAAVYRMYVFMHFHQHLIFSSFSF